MKEAIDLYLEDNPNPCEMLKGEFTLKLKAQKKSITKDLL